MLSQRGSDLWDIFIVSHRDPKSTHGEKKNPTKKSDSDKRYIISYFEKIDHLYTG